MNTGLFPTVTTSTRYFEIKQEIPNQDDFVFIEFHTAFIENEGGINDNWVVEFILDYKSDYFDLSEGKLGFSWMYVGPNMPYFILKVNEIEIASLQIAPRFIEASITKVFNKLTKLNVKVEWTEDHIDMNDVTMTVQGKEGGSGWKELLTKVEWDWRSNKVINFSANSRGDSVFAGNDYFS